MKHNVRKYALAIAAVAWAACASPASGQQILSYDDTALPLPPGAVLVSNPPITSKLTYNRLRFAKKPSVSTYSAGGPLANPPVSHAKNDCADGDGAQPEPEPLMVSPAEESYVRVSFDANPGQDARFLIWANDEDSPIARLVTASPRQPVLMRWPGGDLKYSFQFCDNYAFGPYASDRKPPSSVVTEEAGKVQIVSGRATATIEWGPAPQPPLPQDHDVWLQVGLRTTCPQVAFLVSNPAMWLSGSVATDYGFASVTDARSGAPVPVAELTVEIAYKYPALSSVEAPSKRMTAQSSAVVSQQRRAFNSATPFYNVCEPYTVKAHAVTLGGYVLDAEIDS